MGYISIDFCRPSLSIYAILSLCIHHLDQTSTKISDIVSPPGIEAAHTAVDLTTSNAAPISTSDTTIAEYSAYYTLSFEPDIGGVVTTALHAIPRDFIATVYPEIAEAWDRKKTDKSDEALHAKQKIIDCACCFQCM